MLHGTATDRENVHMKPRDNATGSAGPTAQSPTAEKAGPTPSETGYAPVNGDDEQMESRGTTPCTPLSRNET